MAELTFSKNSISVTVYADTVAENFTNKLFYITPATNADNQASGPSDTIAVDLLRITHQFVIKGYITGTDSKTAKQVKDDFINIYNGAGTTGGTVSFVYDGDTFNGYIEKVNFVEKASDDPSDSIRDYAKYEVAITFVEGVSA
ncbi:hypothetical protein DRN69_05170 [Candidatus Pacearchaeota archaeon]|nr:MAG: hypothetical protein DRN69_05170 [Candidatus Pacearchaeota archaeon]